MGLVTAIRASSGTKDFEEAPWRESLDAVIGDLSPSDAIDMLMYLGGLVSGLVDSLCEYAPSFANTSPEAYIRLLGRLAAVDPNQGTFDFPE